MLSHKIYNELTQDLSVLWNEIYYADSNATYFQSWENINRIILIQGLKKINIYVIFYLGKPVAILPLELCNYKLMKVAKMIGSEFNDINKILVSDGNEVLVNSYLYSIEINVDLLVVNNTNARMFGAFAHKFRAVIQAETTRLFYDKNKGVFPRKKVKSDIERQIRRLEKLGDLNYRQIGIEEYGKFLDEMIIHKRNRFSETRVRDTLSSPNSDRLLRNLYSSEGCVSCSVLTLNDDFLAGSIGFLSMNGTYHYYMPAFNRSFSNFSPSKVHLYFETKFQLEVNKVELFDFTVGSEKYKFDWINSLEPIYSICIPITYKGFIWSCILWLKRTLVSNKTTVKIFNFFR